MKLLGISGSLRQASYNTRLLQLAERSLADDIDFQLYTCGELPLYNQDLDGTTKPAAVQNLLDLISAADGLLIATPEYNYSYPGVLKNALDWASRPAYKSLLKDLPTGIVSASMSGLGGVRAQQHLRQFFSATLTPVFPAPDFYVPTVQQAFPEMGLPEDSELEKRLKDYLEDFTRWIKNLTS